MLHFCENRCHTYCNVECENTCLHVVVFSNISLLRDMRRRTHKAPEKVMLVISEYRFTIKYYNEEI